MGVVPKMPPVPPVLVVAIVAFSIFAAAALPCIAGRPPTAVDTRPKPLVENLPTTVAAQDFIRARCDQALLTSDVSRMCYELLLPYATSINGSYNRAATAGVTAMVAKLTFFAGKLADTTNPPLGECMQVVNEAISRAKEALAKLDRLDAIGDDKVDAENPDLVDVTNWIMGVNHNFAEKCQDCGSYASAIAVTQKYLSIADALVISARPYWDNSLPSPDGSGP